MPSIVGASVVMLALYDQDLSVGVNVWHYCIVVCKKEQLLALVNVANEVLQTSKKTRGNDFLQAFSPVLGKSLRIACERDPSNVEKIRRVGKLHCFLRYFLCD